MPTPTAAGHDVYAECAAAFAPSAADLGAALTLVRSILVSLPATDTNEHRAKAISQPCPDCARGLRVRVFWKRAAHETHSENRWAAMLECSSACGFQEMSEVADPTIALWGRDGWDVVPAA